MEYRDYYATLGVPKSASQADIRKAFRKLARAHHPDVNKGDPVSEKRFKEISEANEVLSDPEKRKAYDQLGANWAAYKDAGARGGSPFAGFGGAGGQGGGIRFEFSGDAQDLSGFSDFFRTFFAGGAGTAGAAGPSAGTWQRTSGGRIDLDPLFGGLGGDSGAGHAASGFGTASARGTRTQTRSAPADAVAETSVSLEEVLSGTQRVLEVGTKRLEVRVPPGVRDGQRIRLSGKAEGGGNIYLTVGVRPHRVFTRDGANLTRELPSASARRCSARRSTSARSTDASSPCASRRARRPVASSGSPGRASRASARTVAATSSCGRRSSYPVPSTSRARRSPASSSITSTNPIRG